MTQFLASTTDVNLAAWKGTWAYHVIKANQSFLSSECASRLIRTCFDITKFHCARTKCGMIATNVFAPFARCSSKSELAKRRYITVLTDASNRGTSNDAARRSLFHPNWSSACEIARIWKWKRWNVCNHYEDSQLNTKKVTGLHMVFLLVFGEKKYNLADFAQSHHIIEKTIFKVFASQTKFCFSNTPRLYLKFSIFNRQKTISHVFWRPTNENAIKKFLYIFNEIFHILWNWPNRMPIFMLRRFGHTGGIVFTSRVSTSLKPEWQWR